MQRRIFFISHSDRVFSVVQNGTISLIFQNHYKPLNMGLNLKFVFFIPIQFNSIQFNSRGQFANRRIQGNCHKGDLTIKVHGIWNTYSLFKLFRLWFVHETAGLYNLLKIQLPATAKIIIRTRTIQWNMTNTLSFDQNHHSTYIMIVQQKSVKILSIEL